MTIESARKWLVLGSLIVTGTHFIFFLIAPAVGYPIEYEHSIRLLQISTPVFLGYLGAASRFVFQRHKATDQVVISNPLLGTLIRGPFIVFGLASIAALCAFGYSNRLNAPPGVGMSVDTLATAVTTALGLLAVTTNVAVSALFGGEDRNKEAGGSQND